ncbi:hypothetical protein N7495_006131 [Penicillium taxi]|uniref:uncharacterized protein n=1 Tax=Penicillium taxi TaxID=168475 RepID=UPI002545B0CB|nr:uncharacterized protein N7495_006131 [Penicillium taxi]KAJ5894440.1 hypothetical protein N7495_006131 [Penicillium taxi]
MPGVIMEAASETLRNQGLGVALGNVSNSYGGNDKASQLSDSVNGPIHVNGANMNDSMAPCKIPGDNTEAKFNLPHITQGFFPFGTLVNRATQQCWNEFSELITEISTIQVPSEGPTQPVTSGKPFGNQSDENIRKKVRIMEFANAKRSEFIKLLVLSQWSRQAAEVSRLIDIQGFIRTRHQAYEAAVQYVGEMKRDLVRAQVANPDLKTALEVLSKGRVVTLPDFGYKPPKPLTARATLKKLHKINRIISVRLAVYDQIPPSLQNYRVHDGRVTFIVPGEFELDLSVAEEAETSQFFFVDIRFLFSPSSPLLKGAILTELESKTNEILRNKGLTGGFDFLHGLVLTTKVNTLFRQAVDLARGLWLDSLRIEMLHRTLVVQYWPASTGPKSWIEIGVQRCLKGGTGDASGKVSRVGLRWMRDGQQATMDSIRFDVNDLSMERILRSVIALHTSHILSTAYASLKRNLLFFNRELFLQAHLSRSDPGDCYLDIQLTPFRSLRVFVEPSSGTITLSGTPSVMDRSEIERASTKSAIDELLSRVTRLRCATAVDEIESVTRALGLDIVSQRVLGLDIRRSFPSSTIRSLFFTHRLWDRRWVAAATSSMDGDKWWLVQTLASETSREVSFTSVGYNSPTHRLAHPISNTLIPSHRRSDYSSCAELVHGLTGVLAIYANARCLADLPNVNLYPPLEKLKLGADLEVPDLLFQYRQSLLPPAFRIALPAGLKQGSYLQETVRLSFHGIDQQSQSAVLVAHGSLRYRIKSLFPLISRLDSSIIMSPNGGNFSIRLLAPAGQCVIIGIFERLQRLECLLSILQSLIKRGMVPRSFSWSQIAFVYGPERKLSGQFKIDVSGPSLSSDIDIARALSKPDPLFRLQLRVNFDSPSPHRRIQESLAVALNTQSNEMGIDTTLGFISDTFVVLQSLDQITKPQTGSSLVIVTTRRPSVFLLHYPQVNSRFQLSARERQDRMVWLLEDINRPNSAERGQVATIVREKIYNSKGDGWQGLGDGATSSLETVGNLVSELHTCLSACPADPNWQSEKEKGEHAVTAQNSQDTLVTSTINPGIVQNSAPLGGKSEVITID